MIALLLALLCTAYAQEVDGFVEVRLQGYAGVEGGVPLLAVERFRPTFSAPLGERLRLTTTIEAGLSQGWRAPDAFADLAEAEGVDLALLPPTANRMLGISGAHDYLAVDRLYLEIQLPRADVRIGRQALQWGSGFAVNPSDPFPEILLTQPWKPRSGINAVRVDVPIGDLGGLQLVAGSDDAFLHPRLAGRLTVNALGADWSVVGAWREEIGEGVAGIDVKGTLGVGYWFEGVAHLTRGERPWEEFVVGVDYSFPVFEQLILTAQYYRNGSGRVGLGAPALFEAPRPFAPAFGGRDYLMAAVSAGLTTDVSASALWIQNLNDGTAFAVPSISFTPPGNWELSLAAQVPVRTSGPGEFRPAPGDLRVTLPGADGSPTPVDLRGVVPDATVILWSRFNF